MEQDTATIVRRVLGANRVKNVLTYVKTNFDDQEILRITVFYDARRALTVDDMTRVIGALIADMANAEAPFPVVDFVSDSDHAPIAAE